MRGSKVLEAGAQSGAYLRITGDASPDLPLRVLNLLAQQGIAPERLFIQRDEDRYRIDVAIVGANPARLPLVVEKLRAFVLVDDVDFVMLGVEEKRAPSLL